MIRAYSGIPSPHCGPPLSIREGDIIELLLADLHSSWWQVRVPPHLPRFISISVGPMKKSTAGGGGGGLGWVCALSLQHHQFESPLRVFPR